MSKRKWDEENSSKYHKIRKTEEDQDVLKAREKRFSGSFDLRERTPLSPSDRKYIPKSRFSGDRFYSSKIQDKNKLLELPEIEIPKNAVIRFSREELFLRSKHFSSTRSIFDRLKFDREFDYKKELDLSEEELKIYKENPHIRQVFANRRTFQKKNRELNNLDRFVQKDTPTLKYQRRIGEAKTVDHWGQRKLLMSEIEFLTLEAKKNTVVIYAGAAPGNHTNYLAAMFPEVIKWILVDPAPFETKETPTIEIINDFYTDKLAIEQAKVYSNNPSFHLLFICDIRSMDFSMPDEDKERRVVIDMEAQKKWVELLNPSCSMLKFRLPYQSGITNYLDGKIFYPVWGGRTTTETRLFVYSNKVHQENNLIDEIQISETNKDFELDANFEEKDINPNLLSTPNIMLPQPSVDGINIDDHQSECTNSIASKNFTYREYDHNWYEDVMFYFNTVERTSFYNHMVFGEGLDHCFDCSSEIFILKEFLNSHPAFFSQLYPRRRDEDIDKKVSYLSERISREISSSHRTLELKF